jgi:flavin reductase (DIM6/NTAB) family NADH-FMN oxidoreductase RutF
LATQDRKTHHEVASGHPVSGDRMRAAFRTLAAGVVVVTCWVDDRPWGMTVSSCCSVSMEPSRVLVSLERRTRSCVAIEHEQRFGLAILADDQKDVAEVAAAAGRPKFIDGFCWVREGSRPPAILGAIWHLDCGVHRTFAVGDHRLIVGDVIAAVNARDDDPEPAPLLYFDRSYRLLGTRA